MRKHPGLSDRYEWARWWADRFLIHWVCAAAMSIGVMIAYVLREAWPDHDIGHCVFFLSIMISVGVDAYLTREVDDD